MEAQEGEGRYMKHFTAYALIVGLIGFVIALAFNYDTQFQNSVYTLVGLDWLIFTPIASYYLLK